VNKSKKTLHRLAGTKGKNVMKENNLGTEISCLRSARITNSKFNKYHDHLRKNAQQRQQILKTNILTQSVSMKLKQHIWNSGMVIIVELTSALQALPASSATRCRVTTSGHPRRYLCCFTFLFNSLYSL